MEHKVTRLQQNTLFPVTSICRTFPAVSIPSYKPVTKHDHSQTGTQCTVLYSCNAVLLPANWYPQRSEIANDVAFELGRQVGCSCSTTGNCCCAYRNDGYGFAICFECLQLLWRWCGRLKHCAANRKVAGTITDGTIGIFLPHNPSCRSMAMGSTRPLNGISTGNISWGLIASCQCTELSHLTAHNCW